MRLWGLTIVYTQYRLWIGRVCPIPRSNRKCQYRSDTDIKHQIGTPLHSTAQFTLSNKSSNCIRVTSMLICQLSVFHAMNSPHKGLTYLYIYNIVADFFCQLNCIDHSNPFIKKHIGLCVILAIKSEHRYALRISPRNIKTIRVSMHFNIL